MKIYFDQATLQKGSYYNLETGTITSANGRDYDVGEWLDRGGNGVIYKCVDSASGEEFVVKFLLNTSNPADTRFDTEIKVNQSVRHPHLLHMEDYGQVKAVRKNWKDSDEQVLRFIVLEQADCNLLQYLKKNPKPRFEVYYPQFVGLADGLAKLHSIGIHRDIKPENILIKAGVWKLSDFGLCRIDEDDSELTRANDLVGPKFWLSPEGHNKRLGNLDEIVKASDVYQLACVFWFVMSGRHPAGLLRIEDTVGPTNLVRLLLISMMHDSRLRPQGGDIFLKKLNQVYPYIAR